ncbi:hypothetical protein VAE151_630763 [Vibrio aestuarianus]|nr:hypothetical protein VIBAE_B10848 [Vibrio aestuarianus subsp. francensis]CAH8229420.1 hypothetical protein VAE128_500756 [Vibrio aestuarianus]CAH8229454.1 hypothetical protein VAE032_330237 [Vibrio aestuarianus]CAH8229548.1 hypothetical protein VAE055_420765 [Vibrio aestuarianus]CAH8229944.1 hypothetical protein VAE115_380239 [Vibrio aestuarianus]
MSIGNLKDGSTKSWICECYPNERSDKRVRKKFTTKGEAKVFEFFAAKEWRQSGSRGCYLAF